MLTQPLGSSWRARVHLHSFRERGRLWCLFGAAGWTLFAWCLLSAVVHGSECYCPGIWECCNWNQRVTHEHHFDEPVARNVLRVVLLTASVCVQACQMSQDVPRLAFHFVWKIVLRCVGALFLRVMSNHILARFLHVRVRIVRPCIRILRTQTC